MSFIDQPIGVCFIGQHQPVCRKRGTSIGQASSRAISEEYIAQ